jgi:hypothetical protein
VAESAAEKVWEYLRDGAAHGPVPHSELCGLFASAELPIETPVRPEGSPDWVEASTVGDFRGVWGKGFGPRRSDPPPLPPALPAARSARPALRPSVDGDMASRPRRPVEDAPVPYSRPWVRFWARKIDCIVVPSAMLLAYGLLQPQYLSTICLTVGGVAFLHLMLVPMFGATVGKGLLGISIETPDRGRPTAGQMFARELSVLFFGQGLGVWPFAFFAQRAAYRHLLEEGQSTWDQSRGLVVRHKPLDAWRPILAVIVCLAAPAVAISAYATTLRANDRSHSEAYGAITFTGVRRSMAADGSPTTAPSTQPAKRKPKPKVIMLGTPRDGAIAPPRSGITRPTTRPARSPNRPPPSVTFKPDPGPND